MGDNLTAKDLTLITEHIDTVFSDRFKSVEDLVSNSIKGLQIVHETNYDSLHREIQEVKSIAKEAKHYGKITNGRVTKLEDKVDGEEDTNGDIISSKQGLVKDVEEVKQYRFFYRKRVTIVGVVLLICFIFIKESRELILQIFGFTKGL